MLIAASNDANDSRFLAALLFLPSIIVIVIVVARTNMSYTHMVTKLFDVVQARDSVALRQLLEDQGDPNAADANSGDSVLHRATFNNDLDSVQILLDARADVDSVRGSHTSSAGCVSTCITDGVVVVIW